MEAAEQIEATRTLASALQGVRASDLSQATSQADLDAGTERFNTGQTNTVELSNADRDLNFTEFQATHGLEIEKLRLDVAKYQTDAARGILEEGSRQEGIRMARRGLALAEERLRKIDIPESERAAANADRDFYLKVLAELLGAAGKIAAAAHGGVVTEPTRLLVGESGPEIVLPINNVTARLAKALAVKMKPFEREDAPDLTVLLKMLKTKPERKPVKVTPKLVAVLAAGNSEARKKY